MKAFFSSLLLLAFVASSAQAAYPHPRDIAHELDNAPYGSRVSLGTQLVDKTVHVLRGLWDFNTQGGAVSTINLTDIDGKVASLPPGAIVQDCVILVDNALTSGGAAKISLSTGLLGEDLMPATAYSSFATNDKIAGCQLVSGTLSTWVKLPGNYTSEYTAGYTSSYTPTMSITGAALTAGKIRLLLKYILSR